MLVDSISNKTEFSDFLSDFKSTLKTVFYKRDDIEQFAQRRGFPALVLREIMSNKPLSVAIPEEYGGRGLKVNECLGILSAASYESLPLSLTFGINIALFLEPVAKYGDDSVKPGIFKRFLEKQNMGGLMITEPDYGSDALNMKTTNQKLGNYYHIKGIKHWQGLTGMADYWLMTSRNVQENGDLGRDIDFFICDEKDPEQRIIVEEVFNNLGLYQIPYGRNIVDIRVPEKYKLIPESTGLKLMMDVLHRSRYQFAGMAMGFLERILDEAIKQCTSRYVGGKPLMALDQVQHQIAKIQSAYTICSGMCARSSEFSSIENNLASSVVEANSIKAYVTDLMQESAQSLTQVCGANGYKLENFGARGIIDSRPFQIFEGSNEMLYTQIAELAAKLMRRKKISKVSEFISMYELTSKASSHFKDPTNFEFEAGLSQRKMIDFGKIISRIVAANYVVSLGEKGFRVDLVRDCIQYIQYEVSQLVCSYYKQTSVSPIEEYKENSWWYKFT